MASAVAYWSNLVFTVTILGAFVASYFRQVAIYVGLDCAQLRNWLCLCETCLAAMEFSGGYVSCSFLHIGYLAKQIDLMDLMERFPWLWGIAAVIWLVSIIWFDGLSMAMNDYGARPLIAVVGSLAGTLCIIGLSKLADWLPGVGTVLSCAGRSSLAILCVHLVEDDVLP